MYAGQQHWILSGQIHVLISLMFLKISFITRWMAGRMNVRAGLPTLFNMSHTNLASGESLI
jgi:hypothetical protein